MSQDSLYGDNLGLRKGWSLFEVPSQPVFLRNEIGILCLMKEKGSRSYWKVGAGRLRLYEDGDTETWLLVKLRLAGQGHWNWSEKANE